MALNLPDKDFFTPAELAERWGKEEHYVMHLLETGRIPAADKYAAKQGKRKTIFRVDTELDGCNWPLTRAGGVAERYGYEEEGDDCLIVRYDGPMFVTEELILKNMWERAEEAHETVVLRSDVEAFEAAHTAPNGAGTLDLKGALLEAARQAAAAFPARYPEFNSRPPKVKDDVIPWLQEAQFAGSKNDAEKIARILAEHFSLPGATRNT